MLKKIVQIAVVSGMLTAGLNADDSFVDKSLFGVEVGYGQLSSSITDANPSPATYQTVDKKFSSIGLKIGAESEHYRILLNARYAKDTDKDFDYITNYGVEGDYFFNFSQMANFFIGVNAGMSYMKFTIAGESFSRTISDPYYGGNLGFNVHASKSVDLELGARIEELNSDNVKNKVTYEFNDMISGYFSVIFKYQMD